MPIESPVYFGNENDIARNLNRLNPTQTNCFHTAYSPYKKNDWRYDEEYFQNAGLIILAQPVFAGRYCCCGIQGSLCNLRQFCPRCAYRKYLSHWRKFENSFYGSNWSFLTMSWDGDFLFQNSNFVPMVAHWSAIQSALAECKTQGLIRGYLSSEEIAVNSFSPTRINPHTHAIVESDELGEDFVATLTLLINAALDRIVGPQHLPANVHVTPITEFQDYQGKFIYLFKPMNLLMPYYSAWMAADESGVRDQHRVNSNVTDFIRGFTELRKVGAETKSRCTVRASGNMHGRSGDYVGQK